MDDYANHSDRVTAWILVIISLQCDKVISNRNRYPMLYTIHGTCGSIYTMKASAGKTLYCLGTILLFHNEI